MSMVTKTTEPWLIYFGTRKENLAHGRHLLELETA